jgi:hypothetical protein
MNEMLIRKIPSNVFRFKKKRTNEKAELVETVLMEDPLYLVNKSFYLNPFLGKKNMFIKL